MAGMQVMTLDADQILELYQERGRLAYAGEPVDQLTHAWQCGRLAYFADASPALQLACWLHDLGHLTEALQDSPTLHGHDDQHECMGADLIERLWGPEVAEPVRLHVLAKRYMVTRHAHYRAKLSPDSLRSLALQGGELTPEQCREFERSPHHKSALLLRVWDEQAKRADWLPETRREALQQLRTLIDSQTS